MIERIAALSRFISKSTDKCISFFNLFRGNKKFEWMKECKQPFQVLKTPISQPPILSKPVNKETLFIYLAIIENAASDVLVREEEGVQKVVYYVSKSLIGVELWYPPIEKLAYCLILASRKLRPYFQAHPITVLTDQPLRQVLQKPEAAGRLLKWAVELGQFDISYLPRAAIKGQALADFITEFIKLTDSE